MLVTSVQIDQTKARSCGIDDVFERIMHDVVAPMRALSVDATELEHLMAAILFNPGKDRDTSKSDW